LHEFETGVIVVTDLVAGSQDLDAVEALIQGLALFQGGVLMVFFPTLGL
jgi:hypothetical protein